jgi:PAS domain-containing protein
MNTLLMQLFISMPIILIVSISVLVIASMGIMARKRAEYKNQELNAILSSIGEGLLVVDLDKKVFILNQAAGVMLREAPQELLGKNIDTVLKLCGGPRTHTPKSSAEIIDQIIQEPDVLRFTKEDKLYFENKEGTCFPANLVATPFFHEKELQGVVLLLEMEETKKK